MARVGTVSFAILATYVVFFLGSRNVPRKIVIAASLALLFFVVFLGLSLRLVRTVDIPSRNTAVAVSVGFERSTFAKNSFANENDWEMLRERGMSDEEIDLLWTPSSVITGRLALWIVCTGFVVASVFALCFGVVSKAGGKDTA